MQGVAIKTGVVGATGAVGQELIRLISERLKDVAEIRPMASARSAGKQIDTKLGPVTIIEATPDSFEGLDYVFFSAGASVSKALAPAAAAAGAVVVDNSSAFRMEERIPLVIPEINLDAVGEGDKIIANPNCCAIVLLMGLAPLRKFGRIKRAIVSTYQSASGAGAAAMEELQEQTQAYLNGEEIEPKIMPHPYAFNLFSHNTAINEHGWNVEEWKVLEESRKILSQDDLDMHITCIRVPILRSHSESVWVEFDGLAPTEDEARAIWDAMPGVFVVDDREGNHFPMPSEASGHNDVLVGRTRRDLTNPNAMSFFLCGDQLLKGAALNAVQIAEHLENRK